MRTYIESNETPQSNPLYVYTYMAIKTNFDWDSDKLNKATFVWCLVCYLCFGMFQVVYYIIKKIK